MNLSDLNIHISSIGDTLVNNKNIFIEEIKKSVKNNLIPALEDWVTEKQDLEAIEKKKIDDFIEKNYQELKAKQDFKKQGVTNIPKKENRKKVEISHKNQELYNIWMKVHNPNLKFLNQSIYTNIGLEDHNQLNKSFMEFLSFYGFKNDKNRKKTLITSANNFGKYSINFTDIDIKKSIDRVSQTVWFNGSSYYPQTYIVRKKEDYFNLFLNPNQKYFVKPYLDYGSKNIGLSLGKKLIHKPELLNNLPLIFQENINNLRLNNGRKEDEIIFVLFVKTTEKIRTFLHTKKVEKISEKSSINSYFTNIDKSEEKSGLSCESDKIVPLVRQISSKLLQHISKKMLNDHEVEFWITEWDIIFDSNNHPWLLGINPITNIPVSKIYYSIYQQILEIIIYHENKKEYVLKDFIEI